MVDIYRDAKLFTDLEGDSCFSIYQIRWIKNAASLMATISSSKTFAKLLANFSLGSQNSENCYPLIW